MDDGEKIMKEHIFKADDQKAQCGYCGEIFDKKFWQSHFESELHYKKFLCKCGKEVTIKVDFIGSGHDSWDGTEGWKEDFKEEIKGKTKIKTLESKIKVIQKKGK